MSHKVLLQERKVYDVIIIVITNDLFFEESKMQLLWTLSSVICI